MCGCDCIAHIILMGIYMLFLATFFLLQSPFGCCAEARHHSSYFPFLLARRLYLYVNWHIDASAAIAR